MPVSDQVKKTTFLDQSKTALAEKHTAYAASHVSAVRCVWDIQAVQ